LNKRREVVVQKKADAAVVSCWISSRSKLSARVFRVHGWPFKIHTMYWAALTAAMANTMEKAWFQSERIAKQSAPSFYSNAS
jgi:hypothetical protein